MSEKDNLPKADGKKDAKTTKKEDVNVDVETVIEDTIQNIAEVQEDIVSNIAEDSITEADNAEEIEKKPEEVVEEITVETETETETEDDEVQPAIKPEVLTPILKADMHENKIFAALSYIPLGFLIVFALKGDSRYSIYHARQGIIVFFVQFVGSLLIPVPYVGKVIFGLTLLLSVMGIINAVRASNYFRFPALGKLAEKLTFI